jgi:purine-binding chemotaxis protein CheW
MGEMTLDQALSIHREHDENIDAGDEQLVKLVVFSLGAESFAFYGECISEILARADVFFVPGCPPSLEGVINVRGDIESVIRPHTVLHISDSAVGAYSSILLGRGNGMCSGIRVDRVLDVVDVPRRNILPPPATLPEHMRSLVLGVLRFEDSPVTLLDIDKLFATYVSELG